MHKFHEVLQTRFGLANACYAETKNPIERYGGLVSQLPGGVIGARPGLSMPVPELGLPPSL